MTPIDYCKLAGQLADEMINVIGDGLGVAKLNLQGAARLHNWVQSGSGTASALSTVGGEPIIVKVIVQLERPNNEQTQD